MSHPATVLVAVHGGAGYHSIQSEAEVRKAMRMACKRALARLQDGCAALDAVQSSIMVLEDDEHFNAGFGSNLTADGTVECDASLSDGSTGAFGSVGAMSGVKNPICAARAVLDHSREPDPLGRIRPLMLVGDGARAFVEGRDVPCVAPDALTCDRAMAEWNAWVDRLKAARERQDTAAFAAAADELRRLQDTVGAVAWDRHGSLAAGVSSGGLLLKYSGRVGEAAVYSAGCWAQHKPRSPAGAGVACSVSGSGEYIIREMLARRICEDFMEAPDGDMHDLLYRRLLHFHEKSVALGEPEPIAGVLVLAKEVDDDGAVHPRLWCGFTSQSMAIAYASSEDPKPKAMILRRPSPCRENTSPIYITALSLRR